MRNVVFGMAATLSLLIAGGAQAQMVTKMKGGQPSAPAPAAPAAPAAGNPFGGRAVHSAPIVPFSGVADPMNMQKLQDIRSRQPKACGPTEVSPGVWVRIDCHLDTSPLLRAKKHFGAAKLRLAKQGKLATKPMQANLGAGGALAPRIKMNEAPAQPAPGGERAARPSGTEAAASGTVGGSFPKLVDHRTEGLEGPIKNQGYVGSCTAFALSSTLDNGIKRSGQAQESSSPSHIWSFYAIPKMSAAGDSNLGQSITSWTNWPYSGKEACKMSSPQYEDCGSTYGVKEGTARQDSTYVANLNKATQNGLFKIEAIEQLKTLPPDVEELQAALASGSDLWIAMKIDGSKWSNTKMKNFVIQDWTQSEISGGHAVTMSGYRENAQGKREYLIHNSWGTTWGDGGYAWVNESMVKSMMHYAFRVKLGGQAAPTAITDDDYDWDELVDLGTMKCAVICPDDTRPNNGCSTAAGARTRTGGRRAHEP
jgi:C1A family cysteine protease